MFAIRSDPRGSRSSAVTAFSRIATSDLAENSANAQAIHFDALDLVQCFYDPRRSKGIAIVRRDSPQPMRTSEAYAHRIARSLDNECCFL
jgi:hypothetical protein